MLAFPSSQLLDRMSVCSLVEVFQNMRHIFRETQTQCQCINQQVSNDVSLVWLVTNFDFFFFKM